MSVKKTIILKLGGLGDLLMSTPAIRAYKKSFKQDKVILLTGKTNKNVIKNSPFIDAIVTIDDKKLLSGNLLNRIIEALKLFKILKKLNAHDIYILHRDWRYNLISYLAGIKNRYGFSRDLKGIFLSYSVDNDKSIHEINKYLSLFSLRSGFLSDGIGIDVYPLKGEEAKVETCLRVMYNNDTVIAISPGGANNAKMEMDIKRWNLEYYLELIEKLLDSNFAILLVGGPSDTMYIEKIINKFRDYYGKKIFDTVSNKFSIQETYCAINKCTLMVTHDCGPMHIGAATGIPIVSIFGPTSPIEYRPMSNDENKCVYTGSMMSCSPCYNDGTFPDCRHNKCMLSLKPETIMERIQEILSKNGGSNDGL